MDEVRARARRRLVQRHARQVGAAYGHSIEVEQLRYVAHAWQGPRAPPLRARRAAARANERARVRVRVSRSTTEASPARTSRVVPKASCLRFSIAMRQGRSRPRCYNPAAMPSVTERESAEFFVVGGPVQAERPCYVERAADRRLEAALREQALVLACSARARSASRACCCARRARCERRGRSLQRSICAASPIRPKPKTRIGWLRLVAARIAGELKLGVDVDSWWSSRDALGDNRLVEFFWEVVLTNTTAPIVVLFDEIDSALELPFGAELLDAIGACYERRSRESDFARLGFALAGSVSQRELAEEGAASVFAQARGRRARRLQRRADVPLRRSVRRRPRRSRKALLDRISRVDGRPPVSDAARRARRRSQRRQARGCRARRARAVVGAGCRRQGSAARPRSRVAQRADTPGAPGDAAAAEARQRRQSRAARGRRGVGAAVAVGNGGRVRRSAQSSCPQPIVKELVAARWLRPKRGRMAMGHGCRARAGRRRGRRLLVHAAVARRGYRNPDEARPPSRARPRMPIGVCAALPGFRRACRRALARRARAPKPRRDDAYAAAAAADTRLRELPGQDAAADGLLSEFWLRRAREQAHAEQRDAAILLAQRAAALPAADPAAVTLLAELVGDDYSRLERSLRPGRAARVLAHGVRASAGRIDRCGAASPAHSVRRVRPLAMRSTLCRSS